MAVEKVELEEEQVGQEQTTGQEEAQGLPDHAGGKAQGQTRADIIEQTLAEAGENAGEEAILDQLATKEGPLTIEELRKLPGAEGLTDDQIKMEWARASKAERAAGGVADPSANVEGEQEAQYKLPFPFYGASGEKIESLEKIALKDLFEGKIKLGYQALGKEQQKTLAEAIRNASMGHWNEQRYNTTLQERDKVATELTTAKEQLAKYTSERDVWNTALSALAMGNIEPMKALAQAYQQELMKGGIAQVQPVEQTQATGDNEAGLKFIRETLAPAGMEIAQKYGADVKEVYNALEHYIRREGQFLTKEKLDQIIQFEVPQLFEQNGYSANDIPVKKDGDVAELRKTVEALQSRIAEQKNQATATIRQRQKNIPPAGGGATPSAGDAMPAFKSRSQMKAYLQGDENWAKA